MSEHANTYNVDEATNKMLAKFGIQRHKGVYEIVDPDRLRMECHDTYLVGEDMPVEIKNHNAWVRSKYTTLTILEDDFKRLKV